MAFMQLLRIASTGTLLTYMISFVLWDMEAVRLYILLPIYLRADDTPKNVISHFVLLEICCGEVSETFS